MKFTGNFLRILPTILKISLWQPLLAAHFWWCPCRRCPSPPLRRYSTRTPRRDSPCPCASWTFSSSSPSPHSRSAAHCDGVCRRWSPPWRSWWVWRSNWSPPHSSGDTGSRGSGHWSCAGSTGPGKRGKLYAASRIIWRKFEVSYHQSEIFNVLLQKQIKFRSFR